MGSYSSENQRNFWDISENEKNGAFWLTNLFFHFAFFSNFFRSKLHLRTFWSSLSSHLLDFLPYMTRNCIFPRQFLPFSLKLRKSLLEVWFVDENIGHFTENSLISWWIGTNFKRTFRIPAGLKEKTTIELFYAKLLEIWSYKFYHTKENPILSVSSGGATF